MKKFILTSALFLSSVACMASAPVEFYYDGPARIQVMTSDSGTVSVNALAIENGYKIINSGSGYATLFRDGRYYTVSKIEVNRKGLIIFIKIERLK